MGTTQTYGLRYQELTDPPDGAAVGQDLAEDVETELVRVDADLATLLPVTSWATYTPNWTNAGTGTFTTRTGRWRRIGPKTVAFTIFVIINAAGSGAGEVETSLPTSPARTTRQTFAGHHQSGNNGHLQAVTFTGGVGTAVDRILLDGTNLLGSDLTAGALFTISGVYEEA